MTTNNPEEQAIRQIVERIVILDDEASSYSERKNYDKSNARNDEANRLEAELVASYGVILDFSHDDLVQVWRNMSLYATLNCIEWTWTIED